MPIIGPPYSNPPTESSEYDQVDDLLGKLPDNVNNEIKARDVRDAVYTLWKKIDRQTATYSLQDILYTGTASVTIGGINKGDIFTQSTIQEMWDFLIYPKTDAILTLEADRYEVENGSNSNINLNWSITAGNECTINQILLNNNPLIPTFINDYASGTSTLGATASYTLDVFDDCNHSQEVVTIDFLDKFYYGEDLLSIGGKTVNLTTILENGLPIPNFVHIDDAFILTLSNILIRDINDIELNKFGGNAKHMIFAFPSYYGDVKFIINGIFTTAITKIKTFEFTNVYGYKEFYDVYASNTIQNYHIEDLKIKENI